MQQPQLRENPGVLQPARPPYEPISLEIDSSWTTLEWSLFIASTVFMAHILLVLGLDNRLAVVAIAILSGRFFGTRLSQLAYTIRIAQQLELPIIDSQSIRRLGLSAIDPVCLIITGTVVVILYSTGTLLGVLLAFFVIIAAAIFHYTVQIELCQALDRHLARLNQTTYNHLRDAARPLTYNLRDAVAKQDYQLPHTPSQSEPDYSRFDMRAYAKWLFRKSIERALRRSSFPQYELDLENGMPTYRQVIRSEPKGVSMTKAAILYLAAWADTYGNNTIDDDEHPDRTRRI